MPLVSKLFTRIGFASASPHVAQGTFYLTCKKTWPDFHSVSGNTSVLWLLNFTKMEASFPFT
jgi:hypothetical protein